jgi:6-phosphofructokinase 1
MELVARHQFGRMVTLQKGSLGSIPLSKVGGKVRKVPLDHELIQAAKSIGVSFGV